MVADFLARGATRLFSVGCRESTRLSASTAAAAQAKSRARDRQGLGSRGHVRASSKLPTGVKSQKIEIWPKLAKFRHRVCARFFAKIAKTSRFSHSHAKISCKRNFRSSSRKNRTIFFARKVRGKIANKSRFFALFARGTAYFRGSDKFAVSADPRIFTVPFAEISRFLRKLAYEFSRLRKFARPLLLSLFIFLFSFSFSLRPILAS